MSKAELKEVPFDVNGNFISYPNFQSEWRPAEDFSAQMRVKTFIRGRSAAQFVLEDKDGHTYSMFMTDMLYLLQHARINQGFIKETSWRFVRRGTNYGVALLD